MISVANHLVEAEQAFNKLLKKRALHVQKVMQQYQPLLDVAQQNITNYAKLISHESACQAYRAANEAIKIAEEL